LRKCEKLSARMIEKTARSATGGCHSFGPAGWWSSTHLNVHALGR